jgi:hypothetical protein
MFETIQKAQKGGYHRISPIALPMAQLQRGLGDLAALAATGELVDFATDKLPLVFKIALGGDGPNQYLGGVIEAALDVGAEIVVADRAERTTSSRVAARQAHADESESDIPWGTLFEQRMGPEAKAAAAAAIERSIARHGCLNPTEITSAGYALIAEAAILGTVRPENLAAYRACKLTAQELDREFELIAAAPAVHAAGGVAPPAVAAVKASRDAGSMHVSPVGRTNYAERELLFARALQSPSAPGRDVVGVFHADHMAGIARAWAGARSPEADALAAEYLLSTPSDAVSAQNRIRLTALAPVAALGVAGFAARKLAKSAHPLRNAALTCAAGVALPVAAFSLANRALGALVKADMKLRSFGMIKDRIDGILDGSKGWPQDDE